MIHDEETQEVLDKCNAVKRALNEAIEDVEYAKTMTDVADISNDTYDAIKALVQMLDGIYDLDSMLE